jgi:hypothetical protein
LEEKINGRKDQWRKKSMGNEINGGIDQRSFRLMDEEDNNQRSTISKEDVRSVA